MTGKRRENSGRKLIIAIRVDLKKGGWFEIDQPPYFFRRGFFG